MRALCPPSQSVWGDILLAIAVGCFIGNHLTFLCMDLDGARNMSRKDDEPSTSILDVFMYYEL